MSREEELTHEGFVYANKIFMERKCELFEVKDIAHDFVQGAIYADQYPRKGLWDAEKVIEWLDKYADSYTYYNVDKDETEFIGQMFEDLRKVMEG